MADGLRRTDKLNARARINPHKWLGDPKVEAPGLASMNLRPRGLTEEPDGALHDDLRICKRRDVDREVVRVLVREGGKGPIWQRDTVEETHLC